MSKIFTYNLTGEISTGEAERFNNFLLDAKEHEAEGVRIVINSPGGSVTEGLALYDAVTACEMATSAEIIGLCASAATYIACGADTCSMSPNSTYMTHEPTAGLYGSVAEIKRDLEYFDTLRARVIAIYGAKTGMTAERVEAAFIVSTNYMDAQAALDFGLVDTVDGLQRHEPTTTAPEPENAAVEAVEAENEAEETKEEQPQEATTVPGVINRILTFAGLSAKVKEENSALLKAEAENTLKAEVETLSNRVKELEAANVAAVAELDGYKNALATKAEQLKKKEEEINNLISSGVAVQLSQLAVDVAELPAPVSDVPRADVARMIREEGLEAALNYLTK